MTENTRMNLNQRSWFAICLLLFMTSVGAQDGTTEVAPTTAKQCLDRKETCMENYTMIRTFCCEDFACKWDVTTGLGICFDFKEEGGGKCAQNQIFRQAGNEGSTSTPNDMTTEMPSPASYRGGPGVWPIEQETPNQEQRPIWIDGSELDGISERALQQTNNEQRFEIPNSNPNTDPEHIRYYPIAYPLDNPTAILRHLPSPIMKYPQIQSSNPQYYQIPTNNQDNINQQKSQESDKYPNNPYPNNQYPNIQYPNNYPYIQYPNNYPNIPYSNNQYPNNYPSNQYPNKQNTDDRYQPKKNKVRIYPNRIFVNKRILPKKNSSYIYLSHTAIIKSLPNPVPPKFPIPQTQFVQN